MALRIKRKADGGIGAPPSLEYGELATDGSGNVYVGTYTGTVKPVGELSRTPSDNAKNTITPANTTTRALTLQAVPSQTADLFKALSSNDTNVAKIDPLGNVQIGSLSPAPDPALVFTDDFNSSGNLSAPWIPFDTFSQLQQSGGYAQNTSTGSEQASYAEANFSGNYIELDVEFVPNTIHKLLAIIEFNLPPAFTGYFLSIENTGSGQQLMMAYNSGGIPTVVYGPVNTNYTTARIRFRKSGSDLVVESWNGTTWVIDHIAASVPNVPSGTKVVLGMSAGAIGNVKIDRAAVYYANAPVFNGSLSVADTVAPSGKSGYFGGDVQVVGQLTAANLVGTNTGDQNGVSLIASNPVEGVTGFGTVNIASGSNVLTFSSPSQSPPLSPGNTITVVDPNTGKAQTFTLQSGSGTSWTAYETATFTTITGVNFTIGNTVPIQMVVNALGDKLVNSVQPIRYHEASSVAPGENAIFQVSSTSAVEWCVRIYDTSNASSYATIKAFVVKTASTPVLHTYAQFGSYTDYTIAPIDAGTELGLAIMNTSLTSTIVIKATSIRVGE